MRVLLLLSYIALVSSVDVTLTPTTTLRTIVVRQDEQQAVSTVASPSNGHNQGDIIISIPEAENKVLDQIMSQNVCPDFKLHKRFVQDCFLKNGEAMYGAMRDGGMNGMVDMANDGIELPLPPSELDGGVVVQFDQMGANIPGLNQQARGRLGRIIWWSQYPTLLSKVPSNNPVKVIPAVIATRVASAPPATSSARCHYRDRIPYCANCGGYAGNKKREICIGFGDLWKGCPCLKDTNPPLPRQDYLADLAWFRSMLEELKSRHDVTCLGKNTTQDVNVWTKMAEKACENADLSKTIIREGMTITEVGDPTKTEFSPYQRYKYTFRWDPAANQQCSGTCKDMFANMKKCGDSSKPEMARGGSAKFKCGTASYKIEDYAPLKVTCRGKALGAPRGDRESNGETSLDKAIEMWCTDNNSRNIKKGENVYRRWGITEYGVTGRSSFWLRGAITCGDEERMNKSDCIEALQNGMEQCDPQAGYSHGLAASIGCMDYSIDLSGATQDDSPPWDQKPYFPPPEDAERPDGAQHEITCSQRGFMVQENSLSDDELNKAINKFCLNGAEIVGFGREKPWIDNMFKWPSRDNPKFLMGAIFNGEPTPFVNDQKNWKPYKDMRWCDGYDWKMGKDDCTYALRKMHQKCTRGNVLKVADYTYRCVRYQYAYTTIEDGF